MRKLSKEALSHIIKEKGDCNTQLCEYVHLCSDCDLYSNSEDIFMRKSSMRRSENLRYLYGAAISMYEKRYGKEELFEVLL